MYYLNVYGDFVPRKDTRYFRRRQVLKANAGRKPKR